MMRAIRERLRSDDNNESKKFERSNITCPELSNESIMLRAKLVHHSGHDILSPKLLPKVRTCGATIFCKRRVEPELFGQLRA